MEKRIIPTVMASQHPDHAHTPYWLKKAFITVQDETEECYRTFSELAIPEYKWDWEGKFVDESVIERLISQYFDYFKKNPLGKKKFLTFRLPNPNVETEFRVGRALLGIITAASLSKQVGLNSPPIFEVILPMTENAEQILDIQEAFAELTSLKHKIYRVDKSAIRHIEIIPLFEQVQTIINSTDILKTYINLHKKRFGFSPTYLRPYVARSDPALNSGIVPTVLAIKIALSKYLDFEKETRIKLYPVIGSACLPFRGGLTPVTVEKFAEEYKGIKTALLQSSFRYDYDIKQVISAAKKLIKILPRQKANHLTDDEIGKLQKIIGIFEKEYKETVEHIAPVINNIANYLPRRRERVQHIGLFGYSRGVGKVKLPRAIGFTAALYSIGIPPELIGTGRGLTTIKKFGLIPILEKTYVNLRFDLLRAGRYLNKNILRHLVKKNNAWNKIISDVEGIENYLGEELKPVTNDEIEHRKLTERIFSFLESDISPTEIITEAAKLRKSLG